MKLLASTTSPYARKVRIAFAEKKFEYTLVEQDPWDAGNAIGEHNPLGKVPVLVLEDGTNLYDSRVIVEYIDLVSPVSRLIPEPARQRILVKRREALADGLVDAAISARPEGMRPKRQQSAENIERQFAKMRAAIATMARDLGDKPWCNGNHFTLADVAVGCALSYLDFRFGHIDWRGDHANLAKLAEKLAARPSFVDTAPPAS